MTYLLSEHAEVDLLEVYDFLDRRNRSAALRWESNVLAALDHLSEFPSTGHTREELQDASLRLWSVDEYLIVYNCESDPIQIIAILHGARDLPAVLQQRAGNEAKPL